MDSHFVLKLHKITGISCHLRALFSIIFRKLRSKSFRASLRVTVYFKVLHLSNNWMYS